MSVCEVLDRKKVIAVVDPVSLYRECISCFLLHEFPEFDVVQSDCAEKLAGRVGSREIALTILRALAAGGPQTGAAIGIVEKASLAAPVIVMCDRELHSTSRTFYAENRVHGILPSTTRLDIATAMIRLVLAGGVCRPSSEQREIFFPAYSDSEPSKERFSAEALKELTRREMEVLQILAQGASNKLIANTLGLSENTVKVHVRQIIRKLAVRNRTEAIVALRRTLDEARADAGAPILFERALPAPRSS